MKELNAKKDLPLTTELIKKIIDDFAESTGDGLGAFLFSFGSAKIFARNMGAKDRQFFSSVQSLQKSGYIKKVNQDQFLITPKAVKKIRTLELIDANRRTNQWDGMWRIVAFDVPESKKHERNILRSVIKRMGFVGIQNSVFVSPFANFDQLSKLRSDLNIEKYVSFFEAKVADTDDDLKLRKRFNL